MSVLSRFRRAIRWVKATGLYSESRYSDVVSLMEPRFGSQEIGVYEQLLLAGAIAGLGDIDGASVIYRACIVRSSTLPQDDAIYVNAYSHFMVAKMSGDSKTANQIKSEMMLMRPPKRITHFVNHSNIVNW